MFLRFAVTYVVIFAIFYLLLALYERFIKKIDITNSERVMYVGFGALVWPITIFVMIIFFIVKSINFTKKI